MSTCHMHETCHRLIRMVALAPRWPFVVRLVEFGWSVACWCVEWSTGCPIQRPDVHAVLSVLGSALLGETVRRNRTPGAVRCDSQSAVGVALPPAHRGRSLSVLSRTSGAPMGAPHGARTCLGCRDVLWYSCPPPASCNLEVPKSFPAPLRTSPYT